MPGSIYLMTNKTNKKKIRDYIRINCKLCKHGWGFGEKVCCSAETTIIKNPPNKVKNTGDVLFEPKEKIPITLTMIAKCKILKYRNIPSYPYTQEYTTYINK